MQQDNWRTFRFDQIADNIAERVEPAEAETDIYVGLEHLDPNSLRLRRWGTPADVEGTKLRFYPGDVIFGRRRAYQRKLAVAEFEGICSAHAMVLRARPDVCLPEFLPFFLQSDRFFERAMAISVGSLSPTINWKTLAVQEFPLPPLDEQRRIAEILWAAEDAVIGYKKVEGELTILLRSYQEQIIWRAEHPRTKLATCLIQIVAGKSVLGANRPATDGEVGVLKVSAVGEHGFVPAENKALLDKADFIERYKVRAGDILITRANTRELVGRVCAVPKDFPSLMLSDKTLRLEADPDRVNPRFLLHALQCAQARSQIEAVASGTGGAMKNISQDDIRGLMVPMPEKVIQDQISHTLKSIELALEHIQRHVAQCRKIRTELTNGLLYSNSM